MDKNYLQELMNFLLPSEEEENKREKSVLHLASLGWSLPAHSSYRQINEIAKPEYKSEQVDKKFVHFYTENENSILKDLVFNTLKGTIDFYPWQNTVEECYESFSNNRFLVVVPTLLTVVDGYLSLKVGTFKTTNIRIISPTKNKANEKKDHRLDKTIWLSISAIINNLFQKTNFSGNAPDALNRHWILHGRNTPIEAKVDSVKLFNLLGSLSIA